MVIKKSEGNNETEKTLSHLCEKTFLKLWAYPNPFKKPGDELCDLLAIFENHIFIFQAKQIKFNHEKDWQVAWERWKRKAVDAQIDQLRRAKNWILQNPNKIYLDSKCQTPLPIDISNKDLIIHQILVAYGAKEACEEFSDANIYGSLAVSYSDDFPTEGIFPFMLHLGRKDIVHVFDAHNLEIILSELDTVFDFTSYLKAKETAIQKYDVISYCGEEDLLAHYFSNIDEANNVHFIGVKDQDFNGLVIAEGEWQAFIKLAAYKRRKVANEISYIWDQFLQQTYQYALDGEMLGDVSVFSGEDAVHEMAKEPRFSRRTLSFAIKNAVQNFPTDIPGFARNLTYMPSFFKEKGFVFLQVRDPNITDYDNEYRPRRQALLQIACGVTKNKFPHLEKVIGIAIDAPKFSKGNSEDFLIIDCKEWTEESRKFYEDANQDLAFYKSNSMKTRFLRVKEFPEDINPIKNKIGRNETCPCRSGRKYKKCCGK